MKTTKTNLIKELSLRVYNKIGEDQLKGLLMEGKPLMTHDELNQHISENLYEYLSTEEQKQLLAENLYNVDDENIKSLMIKLAIEMASGYVLTAIMKALSDEDFVGNNPYLLHSNPQMFIMAKYFDEVLGVKLSVNNTDQFLEI